MAVVKTKRDKMKAEDRFTKAKETAESLQAGFGSTLFKVPKDVPIYRLKEGTHRIDLVPWIVGQITLPDGTKLNQDNADPGAIHWECSIMAHGGVGPENRRYICPFRPTPKSTTGDSCPMHDYANELQENDGDPKLIKDVRKTSARMGFLLIDLKERSKGIQFCETSRFDLGELISNKIDLMDEDSASLQFFHPSKDKTLVIKVKKSSMGEGSGTYDKAVALEFEDRKVQHKYEVKGDHLYFDGKKVPCIEEWVEVLGYDDLEKIFKQKSSAKNKAKDEQDEADEGSEEEEETEETEEEETEEEGTTFEVGNVVMFDGAEFEVGRVNKSGTLLLKNEKGKTIHKAADPSECELVSGPDEEEEEEEETEEETEEEEEEETEEEEEEETEEEEEEETEEEEEPKPKKPGKKPPAKPAPKPSSKKPGKKPGKK